MHLAGCLLLPLCCCPLLVLLSLSPFLLHSVLMHMMKHAWRYDFYPACSLHCFCTCLWCLFGKVYPSFFGVCVYITMYMGIPVSLPVGMAFATLFVEHFTLGVPSFSCHGPCWAPAATTLPPPLPHTPTPSPPSPTPFRASCLRTFTFTRLCILSETCDQTVWTDEEGTGLHLPGMRET